MKRMLQRGRRAAEALMEDTVLVYRGGGEAVFDEATGEYVDSRETVYQGKARIRIPRAFGNVADEQGALINVQPATVWVPVDGTEGITKNDHVELLASAHDPDAVGLVLRVTDGHWQTHSTSRRLGVEVES